MDYADHVNRYLYQSFPWTPATAATRFEAVWRAFLGTKQRRLGPNPPPETQVVVRDVLRDAETHSDADRVPSVNVFVPWGSAKQDPTRGLDALEVSALHQLSCLEREVASYGWDVKFYFRLENLTDLYLLGSERSVQINEYARNFRAVVAAVLPGAVVKSESEFATLTQFEDAADGIAPRFLRYLKAPTDAHLRDLHDVGWKGELTPTQVDYYRNLYAILGYHQDDRDLEISRYFAAVRARAELKATAEPTGKFVKIAFTHPVPGEPAHHPRLYYRSVPERYTHRHAAPWLGKGYYSVTADGDVSPRIWVPGEKKTLTPHIARLGTGFVEADYSVED